MNKVNEHRMIPFLRTFPPTNEIVLFSGQPFRELLTGRLMCIEKYGVKTQDNKLYYLLPDGSRELVTQPFPVYWRKQ